MNAAIRALRTVTPNSWVRIGETYYHFKGWAPDGSPRLVQLTRRPYGRRYYQLDSGEPTPRKAPSGAHPATVTLAIVTVVMAVAIPVATMGGDPLIRTLIAAVVDTILVTATGLSHYAPMKPPDAIEQAALDAAADQAAIDSRYNAQAQAAQHQAALQDEGLRWQAATWAQAAATDAALHPDHDIYRPYGQAPPL